MLQNSKSESGKLLEAQCKHEKETLKLEHTKDICTLRVEMEEVKLNLSSRNSEVKRLVDETKSLKTKAEKYDNNSVQGVCSLIQMNAYNEKANVR